MITVVVVVVSQFCVIRKSFVGLIPKSVNCFQIAARIDWYDAVRFGVITVGIRSECCVTEGTRLVRLFRGVRQE
jgi:hypothetical protein